MVDQGALSHALINVRGARFPAASMAIESLRASITTESTGKFAPLTSRLAPISRPNSPGTPDVMSASIK